MASFPEMVAKTVEEFGFRIGISFLTRRELVSIGAQVVVFVVCLAVAKGCLPKTKDPVGLADTLYSIPFFTFLAFCAMAGTLTLYHDPDSRWQGVNHWSELYLVLYVSRSLVHIFMQPFEQISRQLLIMMTLHHIFSEHVAVSEFHARMICPTRLALTMIRLWAFFSLFGAVAEGSVSFLTLGDWGGYALGSFHQTTVTAVAQQMAKTAAQTGASFVVNTGDNFYYCGITGTADHQVAEDFTNVYSNKSLKVPWYSVLGNHEYGYDVEAQCQLSSVLSNWVMDSRYFSKRVAVGSGHFISFIFLDTSPCVAAYRADDQSHWDPCGSDFPTCEPIVEGPCRFHENILSQNCTTQFEWFKAELAKVPASDWLIVVGHHPADEMDVEDFVVQHGFDLYLNGHTHLLNHYTINGGGAYVTSGAGAMDQEDEEYHLVTPGKGSKKVQLVWEEKVAGFTLHTFSSDFKDLKTDYVSYAGDILHSFNVTRGSGPSPSPPSPPLPPSQGSCSKYGCGRYDPSHSSCKEFGCGRYNPKQSCQCNSYCKEQNPIPPCMAAYVIGLGCGRCHFWGCLDGCCELTTIFLNNLYLLNDVEIDGRRLKEFFPRWVVAANGIILWLGFIAFRLALFPTWLYMFYKDMEEAPSKSSAVITDLERYLYPAVNLVLMLLSIAWFVPLTRGMVKSVKAMCRALCSAEAVDGGKLSVQPVCLVGGGQGGSKSCEAELAVKTITANDVGRLITNRAVHHSLTCAVYTHSPSSVSSDDLGVHDRSNPFSALQDFKEGEEEALEASCFLSESSVPAKPRFKDRCKWTVKSYKNGTETTWDVLESDGHLRSMRIVGKETATKRENLTILVSCEKTCLFSLKQLHSCFGRCCKHAFLAGRPSSTLANLNVPDCAQRCRSRSQVVGAMGVCGGKSAKRQQSRELRFHDGFQYSPLESNDFGPLSADKDTLDIVQFAAPIFVAEEGEGFSVKVMRLGSLAGTVSCFFQTESGSGKAGKRFVHTEGEVVFADGQFEQSIDIEILDSPTWSATLEFKMVLSNPNGCALGKYLKVCRIKVLDGNPFPNEDYAEPLKAGPEAIEDINPLPLFVDFCRLMLKIPGNSTRFAVTLLCDQLKNAYVWFQLKASVYMVNVIFGGADAADQLFIRGDAVTTAKLLGLLYIGLPLLLHLYKEAKTRMDIAGRCGYYLQTSLMRKYMNFSDDSRAAVSLNEVQKIVTAKALDVSKSLDNVSSMLETLGRLIMLNYFALSSDPGMLWAVITMPVVMTIWVLLRQRWLQKPEEDGPYKRAVMELVGSISEYYPLIAAYFQRPAMNEKFAACVTKLADAPQSSFYMHTRTQS
eukprot:s5793_g3.t1